MRLRYSHADTFLQINDQINTVLNRYEAFKKGDYSFSSNPIPAELGGSSAKNDLSLIDFDDSAPSHGGSTNKPVDELDGLFGLGSTTPSAPPVVNTATRPSITSQASSPTQQPQFGSIMLPGTPRPGGSQGTSRVASPNYFGQSSGNGAQGGMGLGTSMGVTLGMSSGASHGPQSLQQQQHISTPTNTTNQSQGKDPFADLAGLF